MTPRDQRKIKRIIGLLEGLLDGSATDDDCQTRPELGPFETRIAGETWDAWTKRRAEAKRKADREIRRGQTNAVR